MEFFSPPGRGLTVPMLATLASAASRACSNGVRSGNGIGSWAAPLGMPARARRRISAITAVSSSPFGSSMLFLAPAGGDSGEDTATRRKLARERRLNRLARLYDIPQKTVHRVLLEDSQL